MLGTTTRKHRVAVVCDPCGDSGVEVPTGKHTRKLIHVRLRIGWNRVTLRVALRHALQAGGIAEPVVQIGSIRIDFPRREVEVDGHEVRLTPTEYRLLTFLARNAGKVATHRQILKEVWGPGSVDQTHYLRVYMAQLRRKIEADPARPKLLITEPGVGYRLRDGT